MAGIFTMLGRALLLHCPRCGGQAVFPGWFSMVDRCPTCGHRYERIDGYWVGAMIIAFAVTSAAFLVAFLGGVLLWWPDPPYPRLLVVSLLVAGLTPIVTFPWSRTIFVAMELAIHELEPHEVAAAEAFLAETR